MTTGGECCRSTQTTDTNTLTLCVSKLSCTTSFDVQARPTTTSVKFKLIMLRCRWILHLLNVFVVSWPKPHTCVLPSIVIIIVGIPLTRGLDNAGKTTIVKKFNGEDIDQISPTLGFNIKTLEHRG